jgi:hypothetical protein
MPKFVKMRRKTCRRPLFFKPAYPPPMLQGEQIIAANQSVPGAPQTGDKRCQKFHAAISAYSRLVRSDDFHRYYFSGESVRICLEPKVRRNKPPPPE